MKAEEGDILQRGCPDPFLQGLAVLEGDRVQTPLCYGATEGVRASSLASVPLQPLFPVAFGAFCPYLQHAGGQVCLHPAPRADHAR